MSDEKDDKSKTSSASNARPAGDKPADAGKRPYATIDLKATELPGSKPTAAAPKAADGKPADAKPADAKPQPAAAVAAAASSAKDTSVPPPAAKAGSGRPSGASTWLPSLVAGAAGAVLAMLGLGSMGLIATDQGSGNLAERLAALEKSASAAPPADMAARLAALESSARKTAESQAAMAADAKGLEAKLASQSPASAAAAERVHKLEQQLTDLSAAAANDPQRGRIPALAQITTRLGDLDTQLTTRTAGLKSELSQEMEQRLAKLNETADTARTRLSQRTQSLEQALKSVSDDTIALRTTVDNLKGEVETRLKAAAKPADVAAAVEPVATKIAGLEKNLATVVRSEKDRNATAGNILLSIELGNLKRAIDRGSRYATELAAVKKVGGDKLNLPVLESAQASGVPSLTVLTSEFNALAYKMLDAEADPDQGSVVDRLLASAKSVIRIRKVAHSADDKSTEASIGRMEASLKEGRLGDVLEESKKLGDKARAAAAPWLKKIEARHEIENALADLDQSLKNALAGSADVKKGVN